MANSDKVIGIFPETAETGIPRILFVGSGNKPVNLRVENNNNINFVNSSGTSIFSINENGSGIFVNNVPVSISGHAHQTSDISNFPLAVKGYELVTNEKSSFNVSGGYDVGSLDIFLNGVKLFEAIDYNASNGQSFTLSHPVASGSIVEYVATKTAAHGTINPFVLSTKKIILDSKTKNDWDLSGATIIELDLTTDAITSYLGVTGIKAGYEGEMKILVNTTNGMTKGIYLFNEHEDSVNINRLAMPMYSSGLNNGQHWLFMGGFVIILIYLANRWRVAIQSPPILFAGSSAGVVGAGGP